MDSKKKSIIIAIMVAMFLGAVEGTVVTTAIPTIVKELNGFQLISWVFSVYLLTSAISTPIYGKLADLYGRKNVLSIGIVIFLIGSSLCGISQNMYQLIVFRALQGLGAGAIFTVSYTVVGDVFCISERTKVQGWLSTVWGIASLLGPFLGGFLIDFLSWHWIFFINIPFGILSIILLQKNLNETHKRRNVSIDFKGILILSAAIMSLLYAVLVGEKTHSFYSPTILLALISTIVLLILFYFVEKNKKDPIMPFEIFTKTNIIVNVISFIISAVLICVDVYMPVYLQSVLGYSATIAGVSMAPISVAWLLSSFVLGKVMTKYGEKIIIGTSILILLISTILLPTLGVKSPLILVIIYLFAMGFGFGGCFTPLTIVIQESVDYNNRGAATASNSLLRTLGQTIGVSVFGSIFNLNIVKYFTNLGIKNVKPDNLYSSANSSGEISLDQIKIALNSGLHVVFISLIFITAVCLILSFYLSNNLKKK